MHLVGITLITQLLHTLGLILLQIMGQVSYIGSSRFAMETNSKMQDMFIWTQALYTPGISQLFKMLCYGYYSLYLR